MNELWKDIKDYEGLYQVSNLGNVKSVEKIIEASNQYGAKYKCLHKERILKPTVNKDGYYRVSLSKNNKVKNYLVHRLVAETFLDNPNNYPCINHKDENKQNNYLINLEFCTVKYNTNYGNGIKKRVESRKRNKARLNFIDNVSNSK